MKKLTVDRIEGAVAVLECENGELVELPLDALPRDLSEGDIIRFSENSCFLSGEETARRRQKMRRLMDRLFTDE